MSSKIQLLPRGRISQIVGRAKSAPSPACSFCTTSKTTPRSTASSASHPRNFLRRCQSTAPAIDPRAELQQTLMLLKDISPEFVNLARLQLALQGLQQAPGRESVRIAILGLDSENSPEAAKRLLHALLVDPLVDQQAWEKELDAHDADEALIVRVAAQDEKGLLQVERDGDLSELEVSSATLNGLNLEILLTPSNPPIGPDGSAEEDAIFAPSVDVHIDKVRLTPIPTPVHKTILVADGFQGAVQLSSAIPTSLEGDDTFVAVANLEGLAKDQLDTGFHNVDVSQAGKAVELFRQGPENAREYERHWTASNVSPLIKWLRSGIDVSSPSTKPVVRRLIATLLQSTSAQVEAEEARKTSRALAIKNLPEAKELNEALAQWAQSAHAELQWELDLAFTGRRWRKLGWWKLYWRVDDVAMLTNEMLSQRFLPTAEQELVYLTGRIAGPKGEHHEYTQPKSVRDDGTHIDQSLTRLGSGEIATASSGLPKWPGHIAFTRRYLQNETVPALQALAQKLVLQSLGTSGVTTSLAALLYVSQFASTLYEAGAVAALGIVYSLGRMQKKWETARRFWEGDVREEGRKAVRGTEESIAEALNGIKASTPLAGESQIEKTRELVAKAEDALARMK